MELSNVSVAVLAGGLGTRLRSVVADRPKVLAEIRSQPFLAYLLDQVAAAGCRSVVLCTGYLGEQIERAFGRNYGPLRRIVDLADLRLDAEVDQTIAKHCRREG